MRRLRNTELNHSALKPIPRPVAKPRVRESTSNTRHTPPATKNAAFCAVMPGKSNSRSGPVTSV